MKEKKARVEDALHAARAAVEEGVVPGGGVTFIRAIKVVDALKLEGDQATGAAIIRRCLEEPLRQISTNAGLEGAIVVQNVSSKSGAYGYNALTDVYEDMIKAGITDPAKVARTAIENGASIASLLLTTEALVAEIPVEAPPAPAGPPGGDMY
jgi:chaperonin GroEL